MRIQVAIPEKNVKKPVLDAALEAVTRLNEDLIKTGASPTSDQLIAAGAIWEPEPPGQEHFDHGGLIAKRRKGDCDDWAPVHAATLRVTGEDPGATAVVRKSGNKRWHAIVQRSDGTIDDPSLAAGMPGAGPAWGIVGATLPPMFAGMQSNINGTFIAKPHLALRPVADRHGQIESWQARTDLPWNDWQPGDGPNDLAMVTLHQSPVSDQAIVGAVRGAFKMGVANGADPESLKRLSAIADACEGYSWEELAEVYGPEHASAAGSVVGSFFGKILKVVKKAANPFDLAKSVVQVVPGVGPIAAKAMGKVLPTTANILKYGPAASKLIPGIGPVASKAFEMATPMLKRNLLEQRNIPPQQRALQPAQARALMTSAPRAPAPRAPGGAPAGVPAGFYPYPYPLPYPVPGWGQGWNAGAPGSSDPGMAWPPRR